MSGPSPVRLCRVGVSSPVQVRSKVEHESEAGPVREIADNEDEDIIS